MDHWSEIHHKMNTVYRCISCKKLFATVKHKKAHTKAKIHQKQTVTFETVSKVNELYKDPGDILPFKLGSAPFVEKCDSIKDSSKVFNGESTLINGKTPYLKSQRRKSHLDCAETNAL